MLNFRKCFISACLIAVARAAEWPFDETAITAPDGSITAKFVSIGATLTELLVKDRRGAFRDVVLGYDDNSQLWSDPNHPVYGAIVGRYANRLNNGTFTIDGKTYHIPTNDHDGRATLHGGLIGWDRRNWTVSARSRSSITYKHVDKADENFPGTVTAYTTHTVRNDGVLQTTIRAEATERTPIMLTQHIYWNLDGFKEADPTVLNHTLFIDASRVIQGNDDLLPTGLFWNLNTNGTVFDFRKPRHIGAIWDETLDACGPGCTGYDNPWVYDRTPLNRPGLAIWSAASGIRVDMTTNQPSVQIYTGNWLGATPRKAVHGGPGINYPKWSGVAIEHQGYIDAVNVPQWGQNQIYEPGKPFSWSATYKFSVVR